MGELSFIQWIRKKQKRNRDVVLGIGDDCAVLNIASDRLCVISADMLVDGTHFDSKKCGMNDIGKKALACSISDVAAMGCRATFAVISLCFPEHTKEKSAKNLYEGIWEIADKYKITIVGGDVISGKGPLCINVTMLGRDDGVKPIRRNNARVGDVILVTGELGGSILGKHLHFEPRLHEGLFLNKNFVVHAMIDISDGLAADLYHVLDESNVGATLFGEHIPISQAAVIMSKNSGKTPMYHALFDGEDYELLVILSRRQAKKVLASRFFKKKKIYCIGEITEGNGIWLRNTHGNVSRIEPWGYEHLKS